MCTNGEIHAKVCLGVGEYMLNLSMVSLSYLF